MKTLHALIVEDCEDDTLLLVRELILGGYEPIYHRVETPEDLQTELLAKPWDIIFSDYSMPHFSAFDALAILHRSSLDIPFIIVSGTIGEDRAVNAMKAGAHDYILKGNLKRLIPATERELREASVRQEQRISDKTIYHLAYIDQVTQLPNRVRFHEHIDEAITAAKKELRPIALLLMDIDRFKNVNDTLGHDRGDILLKQVGMRLNTIISPPNIVARIGGDEFGILLPQLSAVNEVQNIVDKIKELLTPPFMIDGVPISVEASIGIATMPEHAQSSHMLLQAADIAMYRAKKMASSYAVYEPRHNLNSPEKLGLMAELREAIEKNQLLLHFQPKLELKTNQILGIEALVRWQHPRLGLLYPEQFILAAEQTGLIGPLTSWVLEQALLCIKSDSLNGVYLKVSVNLSARSLHDPKLLNMIEEALKKNRGKT